MSLKLIIPSIIEPVTITETKYYCRIDHEADDFLLANLINAARQLAECYTERAFINQTWQLSFDQPEFPEQCFYLELPKGGIQSVVKIASYGNDNAESIYNPVNYRLSGNRIVLNEDAAWPTLDRTFDALSVQFVAGFGNTADAVPSTIKQAILLLVAHWYEHREATVDLSSTETMQSMLPLGVQALLQSYRLFYL